jgi:hypothetical protein
MSQVMKGAKIEPESKGLIFRNAYVRWDVKMDKWTYPISLSISPHLRLTDLEKHPATLGQ